MEQKLSKSEARKAYWAKIPKSDRSAYARKIATIKAKKMTPEQRKAHSQLMVKARLNKD